MFKKSKKTPHYEETIALLLKQKEDAEFELAQMKKLAFRSGYQECMADLVHHAKFMNSFGIIALSPVITALKVKAKSL